MIAIEGEEIRSLIEYGRHWFEFVSTLTLVKITGGVKV